MDQNPGTNPVGLLGYPLGHSLSPLIHNTAFRSAGLPYRYVLKPTEPDELVTTVRGMAAAGFKGSNVTVPHKEAIFKLVDELGEEAQATGAVNTISFLPDGRLRGDNTDVEGFLAPLKELDLNPSLTHMLVLGAGGSARAIACAGHQRSGYASVTVASRRPDQAATLVRELGSEEAPGALTASGLDDAVRELDSFTLIVNCTPVGMHPHEDECPIPDQFEFAPGQTVYDLVYNPAETQLLKRARKAGATGIDGIEMLIAQAAASFKIWTGIEMPQEGIRPLLAEALDQR